MGRKAQTPGAGRVGLWICWCAIAAALIVALIELLREGSEASIVFCWNWGCSVGTAVLIVGLVLSVSGGWRHLRSRTAFDLGSALQPARLYLEAFAVYLVFTQFGVRAARWFLPAAWSDAIWLDFAFMFAALFCALAWLGLRGATWRAMRKDLGLHMGNGVWVEIGSGVAGFCVIAPLSSLVLFVSHFTLASQESQMLSLAEGVCFESTWTWTWTGWIPSLAIALIWVPLVEETLFRGALFRAIRGATRWVAAAFIVAGVFALMHESWTFWPGHFVTGFGYAFLREWRGSLIAPIVAHGLQNGLAWGWFFFWSL